MADRIVGTPSWLKYFQNLLIVEQSWKSFLFAAEKPIEEASAEKTSVGVAVEKRSAEINLLTITRVAEAERKLICGEQRWKTSSSRLGLCLSLV